MVNLFSWQEKHRLDVVGFFIENLASDWCGSWQAMQSPVATGPWMNLPVMIFFRFSWQMKQSSFPLAAMVNEPALCLSGL